MKPTIALGASALLVAATILAVTKDLHTYLKVDLPHYNSKSESIPFPIEDLAFCQSNNELRHRKENSYEKRRYSVSSYTFARFHKDTCKTLDEALSAIKNGKRKWVDPNNEALPPLEAEKYPSYFVPHGCDIPFMTAHQMCNAFQQFSRIVIHGDTLSRQMTQGLFISLRQDLISGGIESENKFGEDNPYQSCRCDGQFSENDVCRQHALGMYFQQLYPRDLGLCSNLMETSQVSLGAINSGNFMDVVNNLDCTSPESKDAIWVLQGGAHFKSSAEVALQKWIDPLFNHETFHVCRQLNKLKIIWLSYASQSRSLDEQFPHQKREYIKGFNMQMETELKKRVPDVVIIDWANLTAEAQTSDGYHFLSDVNLVKSSHLANAIRFLAEQAQNPELKVEQVTPPNNQCSVNDGKAVVNERDPILAAKVKEAIDIYKQAWDKHELPAIEVMEPSFNFVTTTPFGSTGDQPVLSRAWNENYAVTDDPSLDGKGTIWGSKGFNDEYIVHFKRAIDGGHAMPEVTLPPIDRDVTADGGYITLPPGKYVTFSGWYRGNYGHYIHDQGSKIAWLRHIVDQDTLFILPYHKVHKDILTVVDEDFVRNRIIWTNYSQVVRATHSSSLTVVKPKSNWPFVNGYPQTGTIYTEFFRQWLEESHWMKSSRNAAVRRDKVIYYTRSSGGTARRYVNKELELQILSKIREVMTRRGQNPDTDLIIFDGTDGNGKTLPVQTQWEIFSSADTAIGPHGSGLANVIWMDPRCQPKEKSVKVIEFLSSERTPKVQHGSAWGHWYLYGSLFWMDVHELYYLENSDDEPGSPGTFIDLDVFERTLNEIWGLK